ncbi:MAG TPA: 16S rRNA (adenine(1518)-N(6)/adenine(1519)-N(6))-dimethyltransferase RsmA [bacterium]|nr:16S rRNA (adenine(1518)-N(6)/adenine(1519)-N(6))-dimethyltransferase RsmA [bacterium]
MNKIFKKRSLGQHFLCDASAVSKIIESLHMDDTSLVIEIGPGGAALTAHLYERKPKELILIEKDQRFYDELCVKYPQARAFNEDACTVDISKLSRNKDDQFIVVSNLPYNVSTVILENLISYRQYIPKMVLMFQKEVGERLLAPVNSSEYGRLTLLVQEYYKAKKVFILKPGSFTPPPKVDSIVVELERLNVPSVKISNRELYDKLLAAVFNQRRKMLRRSLKSILKEDEITKVQTLTAISLDKRPQELTIEEYAKISNSLS